MALYRPLRLDGGDDALAEYPVPINPAADQIAAAGFYPQYGTGFDLSAGVTRDFTGRLMLGDDLTGNWPLLNLLQLTSFAEVTSDVSTSSVDWVDLLTVNIKTVVNQNVYLLAVATFGMDAANKMTYFRVLFDGRVCRGAGARYPGTPATTVSILSQVVHPRADAHTVTLQWKVGSSKARIRPVTIPDAESCSLLALAVGSL